jgi:hypothetical protein
MVLNGDDLYSQEVHAFILASETLLSPVLLPGALTAEERKVVEMYAARVHQHFQDIPGSKP